MIDNEDLIKLAVSFGFDVLDFFIGHIPIIDTVMDAIGTWVAYKLWDNKGFIAGWEFFEVTGQIDSFIPTITLIGLYSVFVED